MPFFCDKRTLINCTFKLLVMFKNKVDKRNNNVSYL